MGDEPAADLMQAAKEYAEGSDPHEVLCQLSGRALGYLEAMKDDTFPYQFLKHRLPSPKKSRFGLIRSGDND